ncbi:MAG: ABC transporter substrate-binding protein [Anaerosomatales bacterium]|nr:ABC transporter substrate-binding protein [Anaerosomatales bacterium]
MSRSGARWGAVLVVVALLAGALAGCGAKEGGGSDAGSGTTQKEPYRVGVVVSLTGTYAGLGVPEKKAIELQRDAINASGGVNGHPIEVIFEDDATDPAKAAAAATKLIEQDGVLAIIGATGTAQTMAMRAEVQRAGVPQVSMAGGSVITDQLDPLVFQTPWPNRIVVPFVLKAMARKGLTKVAVISDSGGYGKDGHAIIVKEAPAAGVTIVADETFNPGDTDMSSQLTKIRAAKPDAVLMWNAGKEAALIAKGMKQLGMTQPLFGGPGNGRKEFIQGAGDGAEGFRFAAGKILVPSAYGTDTEAYKVATEFIDSYTAKYGESPDIFAGHAYDAFLIVVDALKRIEGDATPAKLRDAIEQTKGLVGVGGTFTYSPQDHNGLTESELVLYRVENGAWVLDEQ